MAKDEGERCPNSETLNRILSECQDGARSQSACFTSRIREGSGQGLPCGSSGPKRISELGKSAKIDWEITIENHDGRGKGNNEWERGEIDG